jgi:riboflavin biosynthesis pyrimidine reductase
LSERQGPVYPLPDDLRAIYAGDIGFAREAVYANFVSSIDGVVAIEGTVSSGSIISGKSPADRFLMALLRACADAVLLGAGTLRQTPGHLWTPAHVFPNLAPSFAALRRRLGRTAEPRLVLLTRSGDFDRAHPAVQAGALVLTTESGARRLRGSLPPSCTVRALGDGDDIDLTVAVDHLRSEGMAVVLTEGGPTVMGQMVRRRLVDELFLTVSPVLAGRSADARREGLVEGALLLPDAGAWAQLGGVRRHSDHLFLRYFLERAAG